jgi:hypothetical protein
MLVVPDELNGQPITELVPDDTVLLDTSEPPTVKIPPVDPKKKQ